MSLPTHALELDLAGQHLRVLFAADAPTTITLNGFELAPIAVDEMRRVSDDAAALPRRAANLADRVEQSLAQHLSGRERVAVVAAARGWLEMQPARTPLQRTHSHSGEIAGALA